MFNNAVFVYNWQDMFYLLFGSFLAIVITVLFVWIKVIEFIDRFKKKNEEE